MREIALQHLMVSRYQTQICWFHKLFQSQSKHVDIFSRVYLYHHEFIGGFFFLLLVFIIPPIQKSCLHRQVIFLGLIVNLMVQIEVLSFQLTSENIYPILKLFG